MKRTAFKNIAGVVKDAFTGFSEDKITKLSASLSYYTVFSLAPLLLMIIFIAGIFLGQEAAQGSLFRQLNDLVGNDAASQLQQIIANASLSGKKGLAMGVGIVTLLIGATSIFGEIQDSMNGIWGLKAKPKAGIMKIVSSRLLSFGMIGVLGFLLLVSLVATTVVEGIGNRLKEEFSDTVVVFFYIINLILNLVVTTMLFAIIFKVLPDAKFKWKDIWPGAIATSLLFLVGKFAISFYVSKSNFESTFGAAGSLVILLVWLYYSAIILYFGAELTKAYVKARGKMVIPTAYAQWDKDAVIAGAKTGPALRSGNIEDKMKQRAKPISFEDHTLAPLKKEKSPGIAMLLVGLIIYFFRAPTKQGIR